MTPIGFDDDARLPAMALKEVMAAKNCQEAMLHLGFMLRRMVTPTWRIFALRRDELVSMLGDKRLQFCDSNKHVWVHDKRLYFLRLGDYELSIDLDPQCGVQSFVHTEEDIPGQWIATFCHYPAFLSVPAFLMLDAIRIERIETLWRALDDLNEAYLMLKDEPHPDGGTYGELITCFSKRKPEEE